MSFKIIKHQKNLLILKVTKPRMTMPLPWWIIFHYLAGIYLIFVLTQQFQMTPQLILSGKLICSRNNLEESCLLQAKKFNEESLEKIINPKEIIAIRQINPKEVFTIQGESEKEKDYSFLALVIQNGELKLPLSNNDIGKQKTELNNFLENKKQSYVSIRFFSMDSERTSIYSSVSFLLFFTIFWNGIMITLAFLLINDFLTNKYIIDKVIIIDKAKGELNIQKRFFVSTSCLKRIYIHEIKNIYLYYEKNKDNYINKVYYTNPQGEQVLLIKSKSFPSYRLDLNINISEARVALDKVCSFIQVEFIDNTNNLSDINHPPDTPSYY